MAKIKTPRGITEEDVAAVLQAAEQKGVDPQAALNAAAAHFDPASVAAASAPVRKKKSSADQKFLTIFGLLAAVAAVAVWWFWSNGAIG